MKTLELSVLAMREINAAPAGTIFSHIQLNEEAEEVKFKAAGSASVAIEYAVDLCRLFNLALVPRIEGGEIVYLLM